jgi:hypothetical protein
MRYSAALLLSVVKYVGAFYQNALKGSRCVSCDKLKFFNTASEALAFPKVMVKDLQPNYS